LFSQIYECELPANCRNPLDLARNFFAGRNVSNLRVDSQSLRFSRGSWLGSLFSFSDLRARHGGYVHLDGSDDRLICEFSRVSVLPNFAIPPWPLQREVEELEAWIKHQANDAVAAHATSKSAGASGHAATVESPNFFYRPLYRIYRIFSWVRYWMSRRFTPAGLVLLVATIVAMVLGLDPENSVGYQGLTLLLGLLMAALIFAFRFKASFAVERLLPRFGTVSQPFTYRVTVSNLTNHRQDGLSLLENLRDIRPSFEQWKALQLDDNKYIRPFRFNQRRRQNPFRVAKIKVASISAMPSMQAGEARVELIPLRRGVIHFDGVAIARPDPLGLFRALKKVTLPQSVLILPKRYYIPPIALPGAMKYQQGGVALASNVGQSDEFVALREYRRGDPVRHIHWRSWAKTGKPIVKEFEDEFFVRHALILDTFTDRPHTEEFEEAVSVAASFACTVLTQESLLDLLFVGTEAHCFTAGRGLAHADQMLEILVSVQPTTSAPFERLEELVVNHANLVSGCICVLLAWDNARQRLVEKLKAFGLPVLVLVIRPDGKSGSLEPGPMRDEPERLVALELGKVEQQLLKL
jgi:uncharacterized protein (DUF58 family)